MSIGGPQGSVLGFVLLNVFINYQELQLNSKVAKFSDETKLLRMVKTQTDFEKLQKDLSMLG